MQHIYSKMKRFSALLLFLTLACGLCAQVSEPYVLADFSENELDKMIEICHKGGFEILIQKTPFATYGHYEWNESFAPHGNRSVEQMVATAEEAGVQLGVWVQENAVGTDDPFFSSEYLNQYRKGGRLELYSALSAEETTIVMRRNEELKTPSTLNLIMIDDELISYATLEFSGELTLIHRCTRGAFGTKASAHDVDAKAYRIWDSPEQFVEPEGELREMVRQSLDKKLRFFPVKFYQGEVNQELIDESIRVSHGERWEKEGDKLSSLGLFVIRATDKRRMGTTMEELEWMLSKAAYFGVGYGLMIDPKAMKNHGMLDDMLATMKRWNGLLRAGGLTERQKQLLRDPYLDWHLEEDSAGYTLYSQSTSRRYPCHLEEMEPGVLRSETWTWDSEKGGGFGLRLLVEGEVEILNPMVSTSQGLVMFPCALKPGQRLLYDFGETAYVVDANFNKLDEVVVEGLAELDVEDSEVYFLCEVNPEVQQLPVVTLRYITREHSESVPNK